MVTNNVCSGIGLGGLTIQSLVALIKASSSLSDDEAKTVVYWAVATHKQAKLAKFPILVFRGAFSTGKTTLLQVLRELVYKPHWVEGIGLSRAALRDELPEGETVLIDEGDRIYEDRLINRFEKAASEVTTKRKVGGEYKQEKTKRYGATALNRRKTFHDLAIESRCIVISTRRKAVPVGELKTDSIKGYGKVLKRVAKAVDWTKVDSKGTGRIWDVWGPLWVVAGYLGDSDWLAFASAQIEKKDKEAKEGHEEEEAQVVFKALLSLATQADKLKERVLLAEVREEAEKRGVSLSSTQVGIVVRELGFDAPTRGGHTYVCTGGAKKLVEVGVSLGQSEDEWIKGQVAKEQPIAA